jgi:hypothetical protein
MNWVRVVAAILALWSGTAFGATLTWTANTEPDLAGYRVYQCNQQPCTLTSGAATVLTTLGKVTSFNIGIPTVVQYYFVTAYDQAGNESGGSNLATFTPPEVPPPVAQPAIGASPTGFSFTATQGGPNPATQILSISNTGSGTLNWTTIDNVPWMTLSRASGTNTGVVIVSVITGATNPGTYHGIITLSGTGATSVSVPVTFTVTTAPAPPPPPPLIAPPTPNGLRINSLR